jgi:DNA integrity scanning protein DisA with diadenylate cyclase activity
MDSKKEDKKLEETLIQTGLKIAKRGEGALFVVGKIEYKPLVNQTIPPFKAVSNPKLLESLALMDGAVIINEKGYVTAYGVMIKSKRTLKNFGTRHSAGLSAAKGNNLVVIVSEEERKIKILKKGKMIMQIDALQKNVEKNVSVAVKTLESIGAGTIGTIGTSLLLPALGISFLPGVIIFGSIYYISKEISKEFK